MFLLNYIVCLFASYVVFMYCYCMRDKFVYTSYLLQIDTGSYRILGQKYIAIQKMWPVCINVYYIYYKIIYIYADRPHFLDGNVFLT